MSRHPFTRRWPFGRNIHYGVPLVESAPTSPPASTEETQQIITREEEPKTFIEVVSFFTWSDVLKVGIAIALLAGWVLFCAWIIDFYIIPGPVTQSPTASPSVGIGLFSVPGSSSAPTRAPTPL